jgi:hypothetical protein
MSDGGLPQLDVARVQRWCASQIPEHIRSEIRIECGVAARHLTICECRPPWREDVGPEWSLLQESRTGSLESTLGMAAAMQPLAHRDLEHMQRVAKWKTR